MVISAHCEAYGAALRSASRRRTSAGAPRAHSSERGAEMDKVNRGRFLRSAGTATGAAAFVGLPALPKSLTEEHVPPVEPPGEVRDEPILVYVRDAARGEVTV